MSESQGARAAREEGAPARLNYFNYFTEIEETFVRRRGRHLLLGPLDWALMDSWKQKGVPLHVVLRGIESAFDSFEARPRRRTVKSLYYCQEEVEAQFGEWLEGQRGASAKVGTEDADEDVAGDAKTDAQEEIKGLPFPRSTITAHLAECRELLTQARGAKRDGQGGGELDESFARAAARLEELEKDFAGASRPDAQLLEDSLTDLEALLDRALRASLSPSVLEAKRAHAAEQIESYRARMERATYEQTLDNLLAKALREDFGVPRLSLFYL